METGMYEKTQEMPPKRFVVVCEDGYTVSCDTLQEAKNKAIINHRIFKELLCDGVTVYNGYFINLAGRLILSFEY